MPALTYYYRLKPSDVWALAIDELTAMVEFMNKHPQQSL